MTALAEFSRHLELGQVYRRRDLARWSSAVDRHLKQLLQEGRLEKVGAGLYLVPRKTRFGTAPAQPEKLVETFLGDSRFLILSPNVYNSLGLGTTQLYNAPVVYNRKRHGRFVLDGRPYEFRMRPDFPTRLTEEFLLVELLHNLGRLPEDEQRLLPRALKRAEGMSRPGLLKAVQDFGSARVSRLLEPVLKAGKGDAHAAA